MEELPEPELVLDEIRELVDAEGSCEVEVDLLKPLGVEVDELWPSALVLDEIPELVDVERPCEEVELLKLLGVAAGVEELWLSALLLDEEPKLVVAEDCWELEVPTPLEVPVDVPWL